ncbi:MAG TPA: HNH endonuclease signature motif containing protein, partial [Nocardioidaceae bacterium]|nr:HNH endonuclease signature motif containing protein [Nocardioidaceae bacterium]
GERISAGAARRLACEAGVIPAVYRRLVDGRSVVLDMGRKRRYYTEIQRIALDIEQGGCTTEGCDRPAASCDAHHDLQWSHGGPTDLPNGRLLCPFHHHKAHTTGYRMEHLPNGKVRFHHRT